MWIQIFKDHRGRYIVLGAYLWHDAASFQFDPGNCRSPDIVAARATSRNVEGLSSGKERMVDDCPLIHDSEYYFERICKISPTDSAGI